MDPASTARQSLARSHPPFYAVFELLCLVALVALAGHRPRSSLSRVTDGDTETKTNAGQPPDTRKLGALLRLPFLIFEFIATTLPLASILVIFALIAGFWSPPSSMMKLPIMNPIPPPTRGTLERLEAAPRSLGGFQDFVGGPGSAIIGPRNPWGRKMVLIDVDLTRIDITKHEAATTVRVGFDRELLGQLWDMRSGMFIASPPDRDFPALPTPLRPEFQEAAFSIRFVNPDRTTIRTFAVPIMRLFGGIVGPVDLHSAVFSEEVTLPLWGLPSRYPRDWYWTSNRVEVDLPDGTCLMRSRSITREGFPRADGRPMYIPDEYVRDGEGLFQEASRAVLTYNSLGPDCLMVNGIPAVNLGWPTPGQGVHSLDADVEASTEIESSDRDVYSRIDPGGEYGSTPDRVHAQDFFAFFVERSDATVRFVLGMALVPGVIAAVVLVIVGRRGVDPTTFAITFAAAVLPVLPLL
jgi:hypothetical protein